MAEEQKLFWDIEKLHTWDKNPRDITQEGLERLKKQIKRFGQYKPLLITETGEVIGGNMRLKAMKELGLTQIWVSIVKPKNESEKLEYSLSDNDRAGYYVDTMLADLAKETEDINWEDYSIDLEEPTLASEALERLDFSDLEDQLDKAAGEANSDRIAITFRIDKVNEEQVKAVCHKLNYDLIKILKLAGEL
jgi:hypothetical protein